MFFEFFDSPLAWPTFLAAINIYFIYYFTQVVKRPRLICASGPFENFLVANVRTISEKYWPTFWCLGGGAQTLVANTIRQWTVPKVNYRKEILKLKDGGELGLHWLEDGCVENSPCLIIIPGFIGESQTEYMRSLVKTANKAGLRVVSYNYRGLGGVALKTARLYTLNCYEDLSEVIRHVHGKLPNGCKLGCAAVSLGTLMLGAYLADEKEEANKYLTAAMMISPPCDLKLGMQSMERPYFNRFFNYAIMWEVIRKFGSYDILKKSNIDLDLILTSNTISDFIDKMLVKSSLFPSLDVCYADAKLHNKFENISTPLLCICGADDIFQPADALPLAEKVGGLFVVYNTWREFSLNTLLKRYSTKMVPFKRLKNNWAYLIELSETIMMLINIYVGN
ncbi:phospholipase ABHD3 isoform X2 [Ceratitis capitata]|uniref:phospholipase ABHD3 isoform X2 n=1 Tax=Ceratitis capitata TaxID=7213 RepID=UPI000A10813F|nr:phospholipase ABHD3 isoform X2 [Ceratitis capitata]